MTDKIGCDQAVVPAMRSRGLTSLRAWSEALIAEGNSLGVTLSDYADEWAADIGARSGAGLATGKPALQVPLTDEQIEAFDSNRYRGLGDDFDYSAGSWYRLGIRDAERAHGIGCSALGAGDLQSVPGNACRAGHQHPATPAQAATHQPALQVASMAKVQWLYVTPNDFFQDAIRAYGVVAACEWFGHSADSEFTAETIKVLAERAETDRVLADLAGSSGMGD